MHHSRGLHQTSASLCRIKDCDLVPQAVSPVQTTFLYDALKEFAARYACHHFFITRTSRKNELIRKTLRHGNVMSRTFLEAPSDWIFHPEASKTLSHNKGAVHWTLKDEDAPQSFIEAMEAINIKAFVSVPFFNGTGTALRLTFADIEAPKTLQILEKLTQDADQFFRNYHSDLIPEPIQLLKPRECESLQWAAAGKTSAETATILSLSIHTVNQHLADATTKLRASNRVHAVAKALHLGLISPPE